MKVLLFVLVAAFVGAQADFVRLNLDHEISALVSEVNSPRHIRDTNPIARATQTILGQTLEEKLKNATDKINAALATTHHVSKALLEQAQELAEQLKVLGGKYLTDAKAIMSSLKDQLFGFLSGIFGKRDLFENFEQELLDETVAVVLADRGVLDWWANLKDSLSKLLGSLGAKFSDFSAFVKQYAGDLWGKVQGHFNNVKLVAQEYIDHAKNASLAVTEEVLEFLRPYKEDLGSLWGQVVEAANNAKHIALTGTTPPPEPAAEDEIQVAIRAFKSVFDDEISKRDLDEEKRAVLRAVQTEFGKALESALNTTVNQINNAVEHGREVTDDMLQKVFSYTELLKGQGRGAYNDAKNIVSKLTTDAKTAIESTLQQLQGIKENFYKSMFDNFFGFFKGIFGKRANRAIWAKFVVSLQSVCARYKGKYDDLCLFIQEKLGAGWGEARGHLELIKLMTMTVLDNAQEAGEAKLKELKEMVEPYKSDLGDLWTQLNTAIKNIG